MQSQNKDKNRIAKKLHRKGFPIELDKSRERPKKTETRINENELESVFKEFNEIFSSIGGSNGK